MWALTRKMINTHISARYLRTTHTVAIVHRAAWSRAEQRENLHTLNRAVVPVAAGGAAASVRIAAAAARTHYPVVASHTAGVAHTLAGQAAEDIDHNPAEQAAVADRSSAVLHTHHHHLDRLQAVADHRSLQEEAALRRLEEGHSDCQAAGDLPMAA